MIHFRIFFLFIFFIDLIVGCKKTFLNESWKLKIKFYTFLSLGKAMQL